MSWLFSRALVEEYSAANCSDGELSAQLNGSLIPQAFCAPDKTTTFSRLSRFGMTFKPLTADRGEELLMSYLAGFHAKTSAQPEKAQGLTESEAECGEKWRGSFARYDPDTHLLRTHQCSLFEDLTESCVTLPQWGLMRHGECWEQQTLAQTIRGTGFGLSPDGITTFHTPNTTGLDGGSNSRRALKKRMGEEKCLPVIDVDGCLKLGESQDLGAHTALQCNPKLLKWPTPRSCSAMAAAITPESAWSDNRFPNLETVVGRRMWPTPVTSMHKGSSPNSLTRKSGKSRENDRLDHAVMAANGGQLNPTWVEWLMGWPPGWTDLKPSATDKSHFAQQQHGKYFQEN